MKTVENYSFRHGFGGKKEVDFEDTTKAMNEKRLAPLLRNKLRFATCIILLCCPVLDAQNNQLYFEQLTTENGLSSGTVISICQDSIGFLWFGTYNGLNRYDGYTIKRYKYDRNDPHSISHNAIEDIIVAKNGVLWFATVDGLCRFDYQQENFVRYSHDSSNDKSLGQNKLRSLYEDGKGNLWIGTYGSGLDLMDRSTNEFTHFKHDPDDSCTISNNYISQIYEDSHGNLWIATDGGLNLFNRKNEKCKYYQNDPSNSHSLSHDEVTCIFEDQSGDLWIGTWDGGLNRLKKGYQNKLEEKNLRFTRYYYDPKNPDSLSNNIIQDITEDRFGNLWIATRGGGINRYDRKKDRFIRYTHDLKDPHSLSNNMVVDLFEDKSGVFWAGTYGGVNKYDPSLRKFGLFQVNPSDIKTYMFCSIESLFVDPTGEGDIVWLGSQSEGLRRWDRKNNRINHYTSNPDDPSMLPSGPIPIIIKDHSGQLWLGTGSGLSRFNKEEGIFCNYSPDLDNSHGLSKKVYSLFEDRDNRLWIGTYGGGLNRLDLNKPENLNPEKAHFTRFVNDPSNSNSISDNTIQEIYQDRDGILWFGTERGGLNRYDPKAGFIRMLSGPKDTSTLSDNFVVCIYEANDGSLWIGTGNGLNQLTPDEKMKKDPRFIRYTSEKGLSGNSIHEIQQDERGNLWISTDRGISKFDPTTGEFNNYGPEDGLQGDEFANNVSAINNSGIMYFGGNDGLNIFHPNSIRNDPFIPPVVITDLQIFNQSVPIGQMDNGRVILSQSIVQTDEIKLSYADNVISFEFAGLHYGSPENNQYAYFMEGFDEDWINSGTTRKATYTNLDPGKYKFTVKASNHDGVWNEKGKTLIIHIKPPWHKTWWFIIGLYLFIFVAVPYLIFYYSYRRIKTRHLEHVKNEESKREAAKRTVGRIAHELGTPLGEINVSMYALSELLPGRFIHYLNKMGFSVERMRAIMQAMHEIEILENLIKSDTLKIDIDSPFELEEVSVNKLVQTAVMALRETRDEDVKYSIQYSGKTIIKCSPNEIIQVFINLLRNSYDAFPDGKGEITVKTNNLEEDIVEITILDSGEGISGDIKDSIFEEGYSTRGSVEQGRGFGLSLAKVLVNKNNGKLKIENVTKNEKIFGCIAIVEFPKIC